MLITLNYRLCGGEDYPEIQREIRTTSGQHHLTLEVFEKEGDEGMAKYIGTEILKMVRKGNDIVATFTVGRFG